jgi:aspartate carbamoyltransferase catalytic subunit
MPHMTPGAASARVAPAVSGTASRSDSAKSWDGRHLLGLEGLSATDLKQLLDRAESMLGSVGDRSPPPDLLAGRTIVNLFLEDSTRTRCSFTIAARRLGADTIDLTASGSSVSKGETIVDTALNLLAMGVSGFVVRCAAAGGPHMIAKAVNVPVINAGDGRHEHPTQGLLDILTIRQRLGDVRG